jgi:SMI1 / KNR4 family (SUKH-1)
VSPAEIRLELETRGVALGSPATAQDLQTIERQMGISLDEYWKQIYLQFNGFAAHHARSVISLWPLDKIIEQRRLSIVVNGRILVALGDVLIDSDFVMGCLEGNSLPLFLLYERRELAPTASAFFERLVLGQFDFLPDSDLR